MTEKLKLAVIWGSGRPQGRGAKVARWTLDHISDDWDVDEIPLHEFPQSPTLSTATPELQAIHQELSVRLGRADAFLFVFPEFNHSIPGALKVLLDSFYTEWKVKAAGTVTYGGLSGGIRAAEALRTIAGELHLHVVRDGVVFPKAGEVFGDNPEHPLLEINVGALNATLAQLQWWAGALKTAKASTPYPR